jgi:hypothetical protein
MYWIRISNISRSLDYSPILKFCHDTLSRLGRLLTISGTLNLWLRATIMGQQWPITRTLPFQYQS